MTVSRKQDQVMEKRQRLDDKSVSESLSDKRQGLRKKTWKKSTCKPPREKEQLRKILLCDDNEHDILIVNELNSIRNRLPVF